MRIAWVVLLVLSARPALAEPPRRVLQETLGASVNTLGVQHAFEASWSWSLSRSRHPLLSDAHLALGLTNHVSPSYVRVGAWAAWAPLSVVEVKAGLEPVYYFGMVGSLISFERRDDVFDEDARRARRSQAVAGLGVRLYVAPTLRAKLGPVVASSTVELERWEVDAPGTYFYEPTRDTLLSSAGDSLFRTSSVLLYQAAGSGGRNLFAGVHHALMSVREAPGNRMQRVGPLAIWVLGERRFGVREPALLANVYYYLQDPYKKHELGASLAVRFLMGP